MLPKFGEVEKMLALFNKKERELKEEEAMVLWQQWNEDYRTKVIRYRFLLATKRQMKIEPLNKVPETAIRQYPNIPFLRILGSDEAKVFLENLPDDRLEALVDHILVVTSSDWVFRTLSTRIKEYEWEIRNKDKKPRKGGAIDPNFRSNRPSNRRSNHINDMY